MNAIKLLALMTLAAFLAFGCGKSDQNQQAGTEQTQPMDESFGQTTTEQSKATTETKPAETKTEPVKKVEKKTPPKPKMVKVTIPSGTPLKITLNDSLQTNVNQEGDLFTGVLAEPVEMEGKVLIPAGSTCSGVITKLVKGGTLKTSPEIGFVVTEITTPKGKTYAVEVDSIYKKGKAHTGREVGMIGGGAAAGAIIGGIIGKKKGAAIGAVAGAAAGTGAAAATGRENLVYPAGLTLTFNLQKPVTVTVPETELTPPTFETKKEISGTN
ncbi:MAG TPA: hypothetical protein VI546_03610 [candidate division Zixibacteria bacterium]|nr:hypothetical protein [candidate division Zixibacteria bacterium]